MQHSAQEIRKILLEHRYFYSADEVCKKWGISRYRLRQWKRDYSYAYCIGEVRDMVVVALHSGATTLANIQGVLDYLNHCLHSEAEIRGILESLTAQGLACYENGQWLYNKAYSKNDTWFIF